MRRTGHDFWGSWETRDAFQEHIKPHRPHR